MNTTTATHRPATVTRRRRRSRRQVLVVALLFALVDAAALAAHAQGPVRMAVAGVNGEALPPAALQELAGAVRGELGRRADPVIFDVVSRDEMSAVYEARGAPCAPDDGRCLVEASAQWGGRLFVRGRVAATPKGLMFTIALDSVRGFHVADAGAAVSGMDGAVAAVPSLVDALLEKERAFRMKRTKAQHQEAKEPAWASYSPPPAAAAAPAPASNDAEAFSDYVCHASTNSHISWGRLVMDDDGLRYSSKAVPHWARAWSQMREPKGTISSWGNPAIALMPKHDGDVLFLWFETTADRDHCMNQLVRRFHEHRAD